MKIVIAGGSGYLGSVLAATFEKSRKVKPTVGRVKTCVWDGRTVGTWYHELDGADVLINLTGRSVDCRYSEANRNDIMESRVSSINVLKTVWPLLRNPPSSWIQMSSATIYRHAQDRPMTELDGEVGDGFSVDVCRIWENSLVQSNLGATRKIILRTSIVLGRTGGALPVLTRLCRAGFGGKIGTGMQMVSWIHEEDFASVVTWLIERPDVSGTLNCTSPWPLPNALFMEVLANAVRAPLRISIPKWLLRIGAFLVRTETELVLKSRWVLPARLVSEGFIFKYSRLRNALTPLFYDSN